MSASEKESEDRACTARWILLLVEREAVKGASREQLLKENQELRAENARLRQEVELLRQRMDLLIQRVFGRSSEKLDANQLDLFYWLRRTNGEK